MALMIMADEQLQQCVSHQPQRIRQPISVPFLWEEKPGTPKRDWKMPNSTPLISYSASSISFPSPARLVISVPFEWEEKPGKPFMPSPLMLLNQSPPKSPPGFLCNLSPFLSSTNPFIDYGEEDIIFDWDHDPFLPKLPRSLSNNSCDKQNWCSVSETDSHSNSSSSTAQNVSTDPALDFLFPLPTPDAGFLNEVHRQARIASDACPVTAKTCEVDHKHLVKRTLTLGELIQLSRKLSYRRKAVEVKKASGFSMRLREFIQKNLRFPSEPAVGSIMHISAAGNATENNRHRRFTLSDQLS